MYNMCIKFVKSVAIGNIINYPLGVLRVLGPKSPSTIMVIITFLDFVLGIVLYLKGLYCMIVIYTKFNVTL